MRMDNIFKNACFGKVYKTRDGRKAIFHKNTINRTWYFIVEEFYERIPYNSDGTCRGNEDLDIVSEWADEKPKSKYDLSDVDLMLSQLEGIIHDAEHMTTGNFARHKASILLFARIIKNECFKLKKKV